jgi:hypothetical protein
MGAAIEAAGCLTLLERPANASADLSAEVANSTGAEQDMHL